MSTENSNTSEPLERLTAEEMKHLQHEPLLTVEIKLIVGSLSLGLALLGVLYWVSATFFPVAR